MSERVFVMDTGAAWLELEAWADLSDIPKPISLLRIAVLKAR